MKNSVYAPKFSKFTKQRIDWALNMRAKGVTWRVISRELNLNINSLYAVTRAYVDGLYQPVDDPSQSLRCEMVRKKNQSGSVKSSKSEKSLAIVEPKSATKGPFDTVDPLQIDGTTNFHIQKVEVFTGPDEWLMTESYVFEPSDAYSLEVTHCKPLKPKALSFRPRGEPAVNLYLKSEHSEHEIKLTICHHKGNVYIKRSEA